MDRGISRKNIEKFGIKIDRIGVWKRFWCMIVRFLGNYSVNI